MQHDPGHFSRQRGFTLIEALVALVVAALGVVAIVGIQIRTLADTQTSVRRAQAVRLIENLAERTRANPNALAHLGDYTTAFGANPTQAITCDTAALDAAGAATCDKDAWKQTVKDTLPLGDAAVFIAPAEAGVIGNQRQLGVMVSWRKNERTDDTDYEEPLDATPTAGNSGDVSCPEDRVCHLQYISIPARCAPDRAGGAGSVQNICPGL